MTPIEIGEFRAADADPARFDDPRLFVEIDADNESVVTGDSESFDHSGHYPAFEKRDTLIVAESAIIPAPSQA